MSEAIALVVLGATLAAATVKPRLAPEWALAVLGACVLLLARIVSWHAARAELRELGPTIGFLAALLVLAEGCRRAGVFSALGAAIAVQARGSARRLLALVFAAAAATTAVLSLDATVVLLTPIVFVTVARLRARPRPHVYACTHLANSASLLLPVSNLTNLLAFQATGVGFLRFAGLMVLPWALALATEWVVLSRRFRADLEGALEPAPPADEPPGAGLHPPTPVFALCVLALTLAGFAVSQPLGVAPAWVAAAGACILLVRYRPAPREVLRALQPGFLVFVLGLGVIVSAASSHGLASAVGDLVPRGESLGALLAVAAVSALIANLVNNLPATLIVLPVAAAAGGTAAVLAMLIGVGVGPNLTYVGSLATLLWRRVLSAHGAEASLREFTRLGLLVVPPAIVLSTCGLWLALRVV